MNKKKKFKYNLPFFLMLSLICVAKTNTSFAADRVKKFFQAATHPLETVQTELIEHAKIQFKEAIDQSLADAVDRLDEKTKENIEQLTEQAADKLGAMIEEKLHTFVGEINEKTKENIVHTKDQFQGAIDQSLVGAVDRLDEKTKENIEQLTEQAADKLGTMIQDKLHTFVVEFDEKTEKNITLLATKLVDKIEDNIRDALEEIPKKFEEGLKQNIDYASEKLTSFQENFNITIKKTLTQLKIIGATTLGSTFIVIVSYKIFSIFKEKYNKKAAFHSIQLSGPKNTKKNSLTISAAILLRDPKKAQSRWDSLLTWLDERANKQVIVKIKSCHLLTEESAFDSEETREIKRQFRILKENKNFSFLALS